jgi:hypothetical protein
MEPRELRHKLCYCTAINDIVRYGNAVIMRQPTTMTVDTPAASYTFRAAVYSRCVERVMRLMESGDESGAERIVRHDAWQPALFDIATAGV